MATYDFIFDGLGLREWCDKDASDAPMSMAELLAQGGGGAGTSIWKLPFPSLDALNKACPAIARTRDVTKGVETGFLDIKDSLKVVLDPITQPLSWFLEGALYTFQNTPWFIMIP
ncbi:MAG TPA: glycine/betaine ABC transporter permease, partial [Roseovarius sp.]|nr:glycine/betaine ABC transporter permease [Roseovarius sp.]